MCQDRAETEDSLRPAALLDRACSASYSILSAAFPGLIRLLCGVSDDALQGAVGQGGDDALCPSHCPPSVGHVLR